MQIEAEAKTTEEKKKPGANIPKELQGLASLCVQMGLVKSLDDAKDLMAQAVEVGRNMVRDKKMEVDKDGITFIDGQKSYGPDGEKGSGKNE